MNIHRETRLPFSTNNHGNAFIFFPRRPREGEEWKGRQRDEVGIEVVWKQRGKGDKVVGIEVEIEVVWNRWEDRKGKS